MMYACVHEKDDCMNKSTRGCIALNDTSWIKDNNCPFYISPEQYKRDMLLIKERTGR